MSFFESVLAFGFEPWLEILLALLLEIAFGKLLRFDPTDWIDRLSIRLHEPPTNRMFIILPLPCFLPVQAAAPGQKNNKW